MTRMQTSTPPRGIGVFGHVLLCHRKSPVANWGYRHRDGHIRKIQNRLMAWRAWPDEVEPVTWAHVFGIRQFSRPLDTRNPANVRVCWGSVALASVLWPDRWIFRLATRLWLFCMWLAPVQQNPSRCPSESGRLSSSECTETGSCWCLDQYALHPAAPCNKGRCKQSTARPG